MQSLKFHRMEHKIENQPGSTQTPTEEPFQLFSTSAGPLIALLKEEPNHLVIEANELDLGTNDAPRLENSQH